ncbi:MAG: hypothetical protein Q4G67_10005 [Actinomycetia bacterium]|nr:hypothetical protein [Actinomycetes bacterium]
MSTPRRRGCLARFVALLLVLAMGAGALSFLGVGVAADSVQSVLDRARGLVESLAREADIDTDWIFGDDLDGEPGTGGQGYTFTMTQSDGVTPATWPCTGTIPIVVNPQHAPEGYASLVSGALARTNEASGFTFELVGESTDRDFLSRGRGPVLLGFADAAEIERLDGRTAGIGGATYLQTRPGGRTTAVGGMVVLDTDVFDERLSRYTGEAIIMHELAHVLGLGHTGQRGELMRATTTREVDFGPGDLAGFAALRAHACGS